MKNAILFVMLVIATCHGFRLSGKGRTIPAKLSMSSMDTISTILPALLQQVGKSQAQGEFYFFFFAGSGALGIGAAQVPKLLKEYNEIALKKGLGATKGGEKLSLNPVAGFGYPEQLSKADVLDIIKNIPSVAKIDAKGKKRTYMEQRGYLSRQGFTDCFDAKKTNQLALYAVFDALTGGASSSVAAPPQVEELAAKWKAEAQTGSLNSFVSDLGKAQTAKVGSFGGLAFLIALVLDLVIESGANAFL